MIARDDDALNACDREPIHIPGSVQSYGVLLAFEGTTTIVAAVSENVQAILGRKVEDILGRKLKALAPELHEAATAIQEDPTEADRGVFRVAFQVAGKPHEFAATLHHGGAYVLLELEPSPPPPGAGKWNRSGSVLLEGRRAFARMSGARSVRELCDLMVAELARITGYDRTMVYRFGEDGSGEVFAERCDAKLEPYLGLHYPASDIPAQARRLYLEQSARYIADVNAPQSALVPRLMPATDLPLDLSRVLLRSPSPVHLEYLRNMGVSSTVVMSLVKDGALWGMLVAHNSVAYPCPPPTRGACDLLGMLGSSLLAGATELELAKARESTRDAQEALVTRLSRGNDIVLALAGGELTLGDLVSCDGFAIGKQSGTIHTFGTTPSAEQIRLITHEIEIADGGVISSSDSMRRSWPALAAVDTGAICGILYAPVLEGGNSFVAWFRNEKVRSVKWAGDPNKAAVTDPAGRLRPRNSFALWSEEVRGRSARWSQAERSAADALRTHLASAQLRIAQAQLARLASHDPLTGLVNRRVVNTELDRLALESEEWVALVFIDLDRFKAVNDGLGHEAGDEVLVAVAARLTTLARPGDIVARFGGDEFVILCRHCPPTAAAKLAKRIVRAFDTPFLVDEKEVSETASVGWAIAKSNGDTSELIRRADLAMYYAKRRGGNQAARSRGTRPAKRRPSGDRAGPR
jgi:diguanylate cyclase (GGDEF)-like protein